MQTITALWAWCNGSALHAYIAIGVLYVLGLGLNGGMRWATSGDWTGFTAKHPRWAGVLLIFKGALGEGSTILRGIMAVATADLRERADGGPAKPLPRIVPPLPLLLLVVVVGGTSGCSSIFGGGASSPSSTPKQESLRAGVVLTAKAIVEVDKVCADYANAMLDDAAKQLDALTREAKAKKAGKLAHDCGAAAHKGLDALVVGENALNTYAAGKNGQIACALSGGLEAMHSLEQLGKDFGFSPPVLVDDAFKFTAPLIELLGGAACPTSPPASSSSSATTKGPA